MCWHIICAVKASPLSVAAFLAPSSHSQIKSGSLSPAIASKFFIKMSLSVAMDNLTSLGALSPFLLGGWGGGGRGRWGNSGEAEKSEKERRRERTKERCGTPGLKKQTCQA